MFDWRDCANWIWNNISNFDSSISVILIIFSISASIFSFFRIIVINKLKHNQFKNLNLPIDEQTKQSMKYYIQTRGQNIDPCIEEEYNTRNSMVSIELVKLFIENIFENSEAQYYIVLADSGMGKTTFLIKLFFEYNKKLFKKHDIVLIPLNLNSSINKIKEVKDKANTIVLLDGFDEDRYAIEDYIKRLDTICKETELFFKVILTCRTQFFPDSKSEPKDTGKIKFGVGKKNIEFIKYYISPFNDKDIQNYLKKKYKFIFKRKQRVEAEQVILRCPKLMMRPMLLNYIDFLINNEQEYEYTYQIYEILIEKWIDRESISNDILYSLTDQLALLMFREKQLFRPSYEFERLCKEFDLKISPLEAKSKSLLNRNAEGLYKFAHKSIYEYVLSKNAFDNINFRRELIQSKFVGLDMANLFFVEMCTDYIKKKNFDDLSYMKVSNCTFEDYDFSECILENCVFLNCEIINSSFNFTKSRGIEFIECKLSNVSFDNAILNESVFSGSHLCECSFKNTNLIESNFKNTNDINTFLEKNCDFTDSNLMNANFVGTNFRFFECLKGANLVGINVTGVLLENVNFLCGKDLTSSVFKNCIINDSNLFNINFADSDFTNIKVKNADFSSSIFTDSKFSNALINNAVFSASEMTGIDLRHSILNKCKFDNVNLRCADISECQFIDSSLSINNIDGLKMDFVKLEGNCSLDELTKEYFMDRAAEFTKKSKEDSIKYVISN